MKMRNAAAALVFAVALMGPAPAALADDSGSDTQHSRERRCGHHHDDDHWHDDDHDHWYD